MVSDRNPELSGNWREYFGGVGTSEAVTQIRICVAAKLTIRKKGGFALVNVGRSNMSLVENSFPGIDFILDPEVEPPDPSHSLVKGIPLSQAQIVAELLLEQVTESYPAFP